MAPGDVQLLAVSGLVSAAAMSAVVLDGFRNGPAAALAFVAGLAPWLFLGRLWYGVLVPLGLYGSGPLFCVAACIYLANRKSPRRYFAAGACIVGMLAGCGCSVLFVRALSQME